MIVTISVIKLYYNLAVLAIILGAFGGGEYER